MSTDTAFGCPFRSRPFAIVPMWTYRDDGGSGTLVSYNPIGQWNWSRKFTGWNPWCITFNGFVGHEPIGQHDLQLHCIFSKTKRIQLNDRRRRRTFVTGGLVINQIHVVRIYSTTRTVSFNTIAISTTLKTRHALPAHGHVVSFDFHFPWLCLLCCAILPQVQPRPTTLQPRRAGVIVFETLLANLFNAMCLRTSCTTLCLDRRSSEQGKQ